MCCSVLQCVAVCCSVLQCVEECCRVLQSVAVCCSKLNNRQIFSKVSYVFLLYVKFNSELIYENLYTRIYIWEQINSHIQILIYKISYTNKFLCTNSRTQILIYENLYTKIYIWELIYIWEFIYENLYMRIYITFSSELIYENLWKWIFGDLARRYVAACCDALQCVAVCCSVLRSFTQKTWQGSVL